MIHVPEQRGFFVVLAVHRGRRQVAVHGPMMACTAAQAASIWLMNEDAAVEVLSATIDKVIFEADGARFLVNQVGADGVVQAREFGMDEMESALKSDKAMQRAFQLLQEEECSKHPSFLQLQAEAAGDKNAIVRSPALIEASVQSRPPMHLHLKEGAFSSWASHHGYKQVHGHISSAAIQAGEHAKSEHVRKMAQFAENARKWSHGH